MRQVAKKGLITMAAASGVLTVAGSYAHADSGAQGNAAHSPGVLAGNAAQIPVDIPVQACGNSANVVGLLNPAMGNRCESGGGASGGRSHGANGRGGGGAGAQGSAQGSPGVGSGNQVQAPIHAPVNACGNSVSVVGLGNPVNANGCAEEGGSTGDGTGTGTDHGSTPDAPAGQDPRPSDGRPDPRAPGGSASPAEDRAGEPAGPAAPGHRPHTTDTAGAVQERAPQLREEESTPRTRIDTPPGDGEHFLAQTGAGALGIALPASAGLLIGGAVLYRRARSARA
ncbi:chaplin family protein [Streptomyces sp. Ac-502]|uniref:chaplin family protein n=1 Tax=Streptomyces sp. Ac-502 TaxID=3342801 RepID=UPI0038626C60